MGDLLVGRLLPFLEVMSLQQEAMLGLLVASAHQRLVLAIVEWDTLVVEWDTVGAMVDLLTLMATMPTTMSVDL